MATAETSSRPRSGSRARKSTGRAARPTKAATTPAKAATTPAKAATTPAKAAKRPAKAATSPAKAATGRAKAAAQSTGGRTGMTVPLVNVRVPVLRARVPGADMARQQTKWAAQTIRSYLPPADRLLYYGGLGTAAVVGALEWPVAVAAGAGVWVATHARRQANGVTPE
jgi:hypothetical protein